MGIGIGYGHYSCSRGGREVANVVDLYALEARTKTARYLNTRQRVWGKAIGLFFSGWLLSHCRGVCIWQIVIGILASQ